MTETGTDTGTNADQVAFWNGDPARNWVAEDASLESIHGALTPRLLAHANPAPHEHIYDIGCGSGAVSKAFADRTPDGHVTGVDVSVAMLGLAQSRYSDAIAFVEADAQTHSFTPESADLIVSRFGVMFFEDPVAAFANLLGALRPGGRLCMGCWGPMAKNPYFDGPRQLVEATFGPQPRPEPGAPGPMGFSDPAHVLGILTSAGFANARVQSEDLVFTHPQGARGAAEVMTAVGPIAKAARDNGKGPDEVAQITDRLTAFYGTFETAGGMALPAHIHFYLAEKSG